MFFFAGVNSFQFWLFITIEGGVIFHLFGDEFEYSLIGGLIIDFSVELFFLHEHVEFKFIFVSKSEEDLDVLRFVSEGSG